MKRIKPIYNSRVISIRCSLLLLTAYCSLLTAHCLPFFQPRIKMNIDLHNHVVPPTIIAATGAIRSIRDENRGQNGKRYFNVHGKMAELQQTFYAGAKSNGWTAWDWISPCSRSGRRSILQLVRRGRKPPPRSSATTASRKWSPSITAACAAWRLSADAGPDAAIVELERVVKSTVQGGGDGPRRGLPLADKEIRRLLKTVEQLGCFICPSCSARPKAGWTTLLPEQLRRLPLDTTLMVAHLMFSGAR